MQKILLSGFKAKSMLDVNHAEKLKLKADIPYKFLVIQNGNLRLVK
ncbi:hypothetical protein [Aliikangiella sp. G2MR2-5]|nr:hypothetical protein [Aliikangiella sp. G2MR2-5]